MTDHRGHQWVTRVDADPDGEPAGRAYLELAPFRGVRFDPDRVGDLADVTAPPYDVIDDDAARSLEALHQHNIVHLILPGHAEAGETGPYARAREAWQAWRRDGVLITDPEPALYVYEQSGAGVRQRGMLGAVGLRQPEQRVILPHEDTMPGLVEDRLALMGATRANLEPIFLLCGGASYTSELIEKTVLADPVVETTTQDGVTHRLWRITDPEQIAAVNADFAAEQALIADGHHRYATYLRLQAQLRGEGGGAGAWDYGMALLVDVDAYPPVLSPIHRVVHGLPVAEAVRRAGQAFEVTVQPDREIGLAALSALADQRVHGFLLCGADEFVLLSHPDPQVVDQLVPHDRSTEWQHLDATVLHAVLLDTLWEVPEDGQSVSYHHTVESAIRDVDAGLDTAVLLNPVPVEQVFSITAAGERMPRKTTSFGPKPRTGLVMRSLDV